MKTLPDYLAPGLDIVLVGINPGTYSAEVGHYFATPTNRFWAAMNESGLPSEPLSAETDHKVLEQGVGLTDVVKLPSNSASKLRAADFRRWAPELRDRLERHAPLIVCFHGVTADRVDIRPDLGRQHRTIGNSAIFVVPNPSPTNAAYSLDVLVGWYRRLKELRDDLKDIG